MIENRRASEWVCVCVFIPYTEMMRYARLSVTACDTFNLFWFRISHVGAFLPISLVCFVCVLNSFRSAIFIMQLTFWLEIVKDLRNKNQKKPKKVYARVSNHSQIKSMDAMRVPVAWTKGTENVKKHTQKRNVIRPKVYSLSCFSRELCCCCGNQKSSIKLKIFSVYEHSMDG